MNTAYFHIQICPLAWPDTAPVVLARSAPGRFQPGRPLFVQVAAPFDAAMGRWPEPGTLQNEWAGAQAFNNVDTYLAPLFTAMGFSYDEVAEAMAVRS